MSVDDELEKADRDMKEAEDALIDSGFSENQWMMIKQYIFSAISYAQLSFAKAAENLALEEEGGPQPKRRTGFQTKVL